MAFKKWTLKHGLGSPGSIAKAITKDFLKWKKECPDAPIDELLLYTLMTRIITEKIAGFTPLSNDDQIEIVNNCKGSLKN
jgi:hypothetical protein